MFVYNTEKFLQISRYYTKIDTFLPKDFYKEFFLGGKGRELRGAYYSFYQRETGILPEEERAVYQREPGIPPEEERAVYQRET